MAQLMVTAGRCQFCHRTSEDVEALVGGDSSFICSDCIAAAANLLSPAQSAPAERTAPDRYLMQRLAAHFAPAHCGEMIATTRTYPIRQQADLQLALDTLLGERTVPNNFLGIYQQYRHETAGFARLIEQGRNAARAAPPQYEEVDIGRGETVRCLKNGLWLLREAEVPYVVVLTQTEDYGRGSSLTLEVAVPPGDRGVAICTRVFEALERKLSRDSCYRGRVLSLEAGYQFAGYAQRIRVHELEAVPREGVILPERTLALLERNVVLFAEQRRSLRELGLSTQKGLLFHGPPGTGKTHTVRYLASRLRNHTTLLITAEEVGLLPEYMALARLLQPALVVIEDADLIARNRSERAGICDEVMLNRLLNELDGLREQADVFFILTTNRAEALEPALASRPGRIDQAVEFPLPDEDCRRRLVRLYARGLSVPDPLMTEMAQRTAGVSPAFIKELLRRVAQCHLESGNPATVSRETMERALDEMLFSGGSLNARLLGASAR
jgi:hypothetical protein